MLCAYRIHNLDGRNDVIFGKFFSKYFRQCAEVLGRSLSNAVDIVRQPSHAQSRQFLNEEGLAELLCQLRDVFNDGQADSPLPIFGQVDDGREERLRQQFNADDLVDFFQPGDNVKTNLASI